MYFFSHAAEWIAAKIQEMRDTLFLVSLVYVAPVK